MSHLRKRSKYTTIGNEALKDKRLSLQAKGLLGVLLSKPDWWHFDMANITTESTNGRDATATAAKELEQTGYLKRVAKRSEGGKLAGWDWFVTDDPAEIAPEDESHRRPEKPVDGFPEGREPRGAVFQGDLSNTELTNPYLSNLKESGGLLEKSEGQQQIAGRRDAHALTDEIYEKLGTELAVKLKEMKGIAKKTDRVWSGWLREQVQPHLERLNGQSQAAVGVAVKAFWGSSNQERYGLADFVKALQEYSPARLGPVPQPTADDPLIGKVFSYDESLKLFERN